MAFLRPWGIWVAAHSLNPPGTAGLPALAFPGKTVTILQPRNFSSVLVHAGVFAVLPLWFWRRRVRS